jgi:hypothetical protein
MKFEIPNSKKIEVLRVLVLGYWSFSGAWMLELGGLY